MNNFFWQKIATLGYPPFVAIHFQEIGGKYPQAAIDGIKQMNKYELKYFSLLNIPRVFSTSNGNHTSPSITYVICRQFLACEDLSDYTAVLGYFDQDFKNEDKYTVSAFLNFQKDYGVTPLTCYSVCKVCKRLEYYENWCTIFVTIRPSELIFLFTSHWRMSQFGIIMV